MRGAWYLRGAVLVSAVAMTGCYTGVGGAGATDSASGTDGDGSGMNSEGSGETGEEEPPANVNLVPESMARRMTPHELDNTLADLLGDDARPAQQFINEPDFNPFDNDYTIQNPSTALVESLEVMAQDVAERIIADPDRLAAIVPCDPSGPDDEACLRQFIEEFGRKAMRRPLSEEEVEGLPLAAELRHRQRAVRRHRLLHGGRPRHPGDRAGPRVPLSHRGRHSHHRGRRLQAHRLRDRVAAVFPAVGQHARRRAARRRGGGHAQRCGRAPRGRGAHARQWAGADAAVSLPRDVAGVPRHPRRARLGPGLRSRDLGAHRPRGVRRPGALLDPVHHGRDVHRRHARPALRAAVAGGRGGLGRLRQLGPRGESSVTAACSRRSASSTIRVRPSAASSSASV